MLSLSLQCASYYRDKVEYKVVIQDLKAVPEQLQVLLNKCINKIFEINAYSMLKNTLTKCH